MARTLKATYLIETSYDLEEAALVMAGEQSSGTFIKIPGETEELKARHAAHIESLTPLGSIPSPSLPGARHKPDREIQRAHVTLTWPYENVGSNLSNLCATVAGNLYELKPFSGLKLLDIEIPTEYTWKYKGPKFGIPGTFELAGVKGRPIIGTIIKPSVGLSPEATGQRVKTMIEAGLDFIKDDELMGDSPHSPFFERVDAVMEQIHRFSDRMGRRPMFAFNISGDLDDMRRRHDYVLQKGGTCIMISLNWVGISGVLSMYKHSQLPIHGHRNGWGLFTRSEALGMEFMAYQKIWRMAGVDHIHTNGIRNKFCETDDSVITAVKACLTPMHGGYEVVPVISSGQWAGQAVDTYQAIGSTDVMYLCGGGIVGHPSGIQAGVKSVQQAWEAALQGKSLKAYAADHVELKEALAYYG